MPLDIVKVNLLTAWQDPSLTISKPQNVGKALSLAHQSSPLVIDCILQPLCGVAYLH